MKLLPDTHTVLWMLAEDPRLSGRAWALLNSDREVLLSAAVVWEVELKRTLGKLSAPGDFVELAIGSGASPLPIGLGHAQRAGALPLHHRDPFDRVLIAQAQLEDAVLLSADDRLRAYDVAVEW